MTGTTHDDASSDDIGPDDATPELGVERGNMPPVDEVADPTPAPPSAPRRWWLVIVVLLLIVAAAAVVVVVLDRNGSDDDAAAPPPNTATVERTDVVATDDLAGTLGYGTPDQIRFVASNDGVVTLTGQLPGSVTDIVDEGLVAPSGSLLYEVDNLPVVVLEGDRPQYRVFEVEMSDGPDVEQLERALVDLGLEPDGGIDVDENFTEFTADAIDNLQESIGAEETGRLELGQVIFTGSPTTFVAETLVDVGEQVQSGQAIIATSSPLGGTVTAVVEEGSIVGQGGVLLSLDQQPLVLLIGEIPLYRTLAPGVVGDDVLQLERILAELGFGDVDGFVVDGNYDQATARAVTDWQISVGALPDGVVNLGDVHISAEPVRVGQNLVAVGDVVANGTPLMATSVGETVVSVELSTDDQDLVAVGDAVVVELPDGTREPAVVTEIGTVVLANQQGGTYFEMTVTLDDPNSAPGLDEAPVDVEIVSDRAENVLAVPVTALLALAEGGYAVEVVNSDGTTTLVAVEPGLFADGFVEVTSGGLEAGMVVVVP